MLISLTGPSGVGKGFVTMRLMERFSSLGVLQWVTTRQLRPSDAHTQNRICVSEKAFGRLVACSQLFLVQKLFGYWYGVRRQDLEESSRKHVVTELHGNNLLIVRRLAVPLTAVALVPADIAFLKKRLTQYRGTETDCEIEKRVLDAEKEILFIRERRDLFDEIVVVSENNENAVVSQILDIARPFFEKDT